MEEALTLENPAASGDGVFQNCESLVSVSLPRAALIGDRAFAGCVNLESLALGETPPALGNDVFADGTPLAIYVPSSALSAYKTTAIAGWTDALKAKVQALP
jgi:hypothetical protein